jgi:hypothetical protein
MHFDLPLAEEKVKQRQVITLHLIVSFALMTTGLFLLLLKSFFSTLPAEKVASLMSFTISKGWGIMILLAGVALMGVILVKSRWLMDKKINRTVRAVELAVILSLCGFAGMKELYTPALLYGLIAAAILFAIYWESVSDNTLYIHINDKGIKLPLTSRKKFIEWWEIEQVLLRFGILTIDCHDNRLFQWNIRSVNFDKEELKRFCSEHIAANKEKRKKYAW